MPNVPGGWYSFFREVDKSLKFVILSTSDRMRDTGYRMQDNLYLGSWIGSNQSFIVQLSLMVHIIGRYFLIPSITLSKSGCP